MQQDSLHTATPSVAQQDQPAAATHTAAQAGQAAAWQPMTAVTDTIAPDSAQTAPLPYNEPLTLKIDMLEGDSWKDSLAFFKDNSMLKEMQKASGIKFSETILQPSRIAGDPTPYQFKNDNIVTIILMASFFLVVWVVANSRHFLNTQFKSFFRQRTSSQTSSDRDDNKLRGQTLLIFQTCFVLGLLFFDWTQENLTEVFTQVSPYLILGTCVGIFCIYYLLKIGIYKFVNTVFFTRQQKADWNENYLLSILALGAALLPVILLIVYFDLNLKQLATVVFCIVALDKILLLYKCGRIFFNHTLGWVHLFLYFCTLEIMPIVILLRALIYANRFLLTIN